MLCHSCTSISSPAAATIQPGRIRCGAAGSRSRTIRPNWTCSCGTTLPGGAGFPTGRKWRLVAAEPAPRLLVVNIDEGEPGTFKDRWYLERDPHRFLEGMLVAAWAVGIAEVYSAGEDPIAGASRDDLVAGLIAHGHRHARAVMDESDLARLVREQARPGDMVVCLGAGTISTWANALPERLTLKAA